MKKLLSILTVLFVLCSTLLSFLACDDTDTSDDGVNSGGNSAVASSKTTASSKPSGESLDNKGESTSSNKTDESTPTSDESADTSSSQTDKSTTTSNESADTDSGKTEDSTPVTDNSTGTSSGSNNSSDKPNTDSGNVEDEQMPSSTPIITKEQWSNTLSTDNITILNVGYGNVAYLQSGNILFEYQSERMYYATVDGVQYAVVVTKDKTTVQKLDELVFDLNNGVFLGLLNDEDYSALTFSDVDGSYSLEKDSHSFKIYFLDGKITRAYFDGTEFTFSNHGNTTVTLPDFEIPQE